jgi:hypothetical protein
MPACPIFHAPSVYVITMPAGPSSMLPLGTSSPCPPAHFPCSLWVRHHHTRLPHLPCTF